MADEKVVPIRAAGNERFTAEELPALRRALERRYPGVRVTFCEFRTWNDDGSQGPAITFAADRETLLRYGLAQPPKHPNAPGTLQFRNEWGTGGAGGESGER